MLKKVKEMMACSGASFVITGEVLGQRPMSQHRIAIRKIEKESELEGLILRPLCAQHFPPTVPEEMGIIDRAKLLSFSGRSRKPQIELAEKLGLRDYPCPAGGCLLTDPVIAARLRDLFAHVPDYTMADLHLLKVGRHFRLNTNLKIILGRNQEENEQIQIMAGGEAVLFRPGDFRRPTCLPTGKPNAEAERKIGEIMAGFSKDKKQRYRIKKQITAGDESVFWVDRRFPKEEAAEFQIER